MASDGISSVRLDAVGVDESRLLPDENYELAYGDLNPPLMRAAPPDGRCPRGTLWKASCKSPACPVCGPRWARRQQTKMRTNLASLAHGSFATIAITAPGADRLPWDEAHCSGGDRRPHKHSGPRGCRIEQRALREWCETLTYRWEKLREAAQLATKVKTGERCWIIERVWEPQKRGAPHLHMVVPFGTPRERKVAQTFRDELARLAQRNDFGNVQGKLQAIDADQAARYLASYLTGRRRKKNSIRENIRDPRLPKGLLWESPVLASVSRSERMVGWRERYGIKLGTGVTMRTLRRAAHLWACIEGFCDELPHWSGLEEAVTVVAVFRRTNPKRAGPLGNFANALAWARRRDREKAARGGWDRSWYDPEARMWLPNQPLFRDLARLAFIATAAEAA